MTNPLASPKRTQQQHQFNLTEKEVEVEHLKTVILALNQKNQITNDIQIDLTNKSQQFQESEQARSDLHQQLREYIERSKQESEKNKQYQDQLLAEKAQLHQQIERQQQEINDIKADMYAQVTERDQTIRSLDSINLQYKNEIMRLEQELKIRIDVEVQLRSANEEIRALTEQKAKLQSDLDTASDYLLEQDQKVYESNQTSLQLMRDLKEAQLEIETLKDYIIELKQRVAVYIPVKDDTVDKRLAEYINNYPDRSRLKIMFMRESEGIYQFGTKKIYVRVEKGKIIIRVGGGYLSIDEFLDIYTPMELEKLERQDPLRKFSEKVAVQRNLVGREVRESSPVRGSSPLNRSPRRSPVRSPKKKVRSPTKRIMEGK